jgi:hypothetical protein
MLGLPPWAAGQDHATGHDHASHTADTAFPAREASGTSWAPDVTPMDGRHASIGPWSAMLHGQFFLQMLDEWAPIHRGAHQAGSINWLMATVRRRAGAGRVGGRVMLSVEPWTIPGCGYPDLLATGELCDGDGLHDRQHPHDLFMELAADYSRPAGRVTWHLYGGPAGEPALGPTAFPHRRSAMANPLAPISHHWLDASHISFGVVTTGVSGAQWRAEASAFNGREPDESRAGLEFAALDSVSGRVTWLPHPTLALQVSGGRLAEAEQDFVNGPRYDIGRVTASAMYEPRSEARRRVSATLAWGTNAERGQRTHAALAEATLRMRDRHVVFGRLEVNSKPSHSLHIHEQPGALLTVAKAQGGYTRLLAPWRGLHLGLGATASAAIVPPSIRPNFGGVGFGAGAFASVGMAGHP